MLPEVCLFFAFAIAMSCVCHCSDLPTPPAVLALQVPCVVSEAKAALEEGFAVVIGLQTTGEAAADQLKLAPGAFYGEFISPTKQCMRLFVEQNFPVRTPAKSPQKGQKGECLRPPGTCCRLSLVLLQHTVEAMLGPIKSCCWAPSRAVAGLQATCCTWRPPLRSKDVASPAPLITNLKPWPCCPHAPWLQGSQGLRLIHAFA